MSAITGIVKQGGDNFVRNITGMWDGMHLRDYLRVVIILSGYFLLRPHLITLFAKIQAKSQAKSRNPETESTTKLSPNQLRDGGSLAKSTSKAVEGERDGGAPNKNLKRRLDQTEKKEKSEAELKKGLMDLLVDYQEGQDGW